MTSNLGSDLIQNLAGESHYDEMKDAVMAVVGQQFRPEFINRIDETVVFHPLAQEQIQGIARIQLVNLEKRLEERDLKLEISDEVMQMLVEAGFDPVYGARPLKRSIQQFIENPLAQDILSGKFAPGDLIKAEMMEGNVIFEKG
jgi:ATP-dependent Clp protease ATP-binding subunit ClpB